jgi:hypothetical protein
MAMVGVMADGMPAPIAGPMPELGIGMLAEAQAVRVAAEAATRSIRIMVGFLT